MEDENNLLNALQELKKSEKPGRSPSDKTRSIYACREQILELLADGYTIRQIHTTLTAAGSNIGYTTLREIIQKWNGTDKRRRKKDEKRENSVIESEKVTKQDIDINANRANAYAAKLDDTEETQ